MDTSPPNWMAKQPPRALSNLQTRQSSQLHNQGTAIGPLLMQYKTVSEQRWALAVCPAGLIVDRSAHIEAIVIEVHGEHRPVYKQA